MHCSRRHTISRACFGLNYVFVAPAMDVSLSSLPSWETSVRRFSYICGSFMFSIVLSFFHHCSIAVVIHVEESAARVRFIAWKRPAMEEHWGQMPAHRTATLVYTVAHFLSAPSNISSFQRNVLLYRDVSGYDHGTIVINCQQWQPPVLFDDEPQRLDTVSK